MLQMIEKKDLTSWKKQLKARHAQMDLDIMATVQKIIQDVIERKDSALKEYTARFDGVELSSFLVDEKEWEQAIQGCDPAFCQAMDQAKENIEAFHQKQLSSSILMEKEQGIYLGQRVIPLEKVGIYVPGGRAQYPSSVLMNAIPAKIAGVKEIIMVTPPNKEGTIHPNIAYAAKIAGVTSIYKVGGAQAIAALAYGTESIPMVDKITGPGNAFVAMAKRLVFGQVAIDMIAGPSEILVIADAKADPGFVAADLLSQAEHDPMASAILVSNDPILIQNVNEELKKQAQTLEKKEIVYQSLKEYGVAIVCDSIEDCIEVSNQIAPEHLELMIQSPFEKLPQVKNAGSVFLGYWTCESIGDYFGGTNHVLPTNGSARFASALGVDDFIKRSYFLHYSKEAIHSQGKMIETLAHEENLQAHAQAVEIRRKA